MAGIKPPKSLLINNDVAKNWKNWLQQFEWYETAVQLQEKTAEVQAATFMSTIGPDAIHIFNSFNLTAAQQKDIKTIKDKYNNYFIPKINVSFERYNFFKVTQKESETFDEFLTVIRNLAKTCDFKDLNDDLLKDKIIFGIRAEQVREKLLTQEKLDLDKAISICKSSEQTTKQLLELGQNESKIDSVKMSHKEFFCRRCNSKHGKSKCSAFNHKCQKCNKKRALRSFLFFPKV
uniref:Tick transposon n=1 Tax=Photinus pyralis TaxID=7054 RepID=A0A1Y1JW88_PHOPY